MRAQHDAQHDEGMRAMLERLEQQAACLGLGVGYPNPNLNPSPSPSPSPNPNSNPNPNLNPNPNPNPHPNPHPNSHPNQAALRAQQHKDEQAHRRIVAKLAEGNSRHVRL